jgi:hypothetical protein
VCVSVYVCVCVCEVVVVEEGGMRCDEKSEIERLVRSWM